MSESARHDRATDGHFGGCVNQRTYHAVALALASAHIIERSPTMASQGNNSKRGNQKGGKQSGKQNEQDGKRPATKRAASGGASMPGNKGRSAKFDSGKQTNR
jgi:hypothetical protein